MFQDKCPVCRKMFCRCGRTDYESVKETAKVKDKHGKKRTVTRNAKYKKDSKGNNWCSLCSCRVMGGRCTNIQCSTRK